MDTTPPRRSSYWLLLGLPAWVLFSFVAASFVVAGVILLLQALNVPLDGVNPAVFNTLSAALTYILSLVVVIGLPLLIRKRRTSLVTIGLQRLPSWKDILLAPAGFVVYLIMSGILVYLATTYVTGFNAAQSQEIGFSGLSQGYEYILAFMTLVIIAPLAEEALFRGYLYGKLRQLVPTWLSILIASVLFAALHLPGAQLQWNVAVDVFALSIMLCGLRELSGSIWAGVLLHMLKNGLAFYLLFINPTLMQAVGG